MWITYLMMLALLLVLELVYIKVAERLNIVDEPNERSSHSAVVLRGGGVIFTLSMIAWALMLLMQEQDITMFVPFLCGLLLMAGVNLWDDLNYAPAWIRILAQVTTMVLMFWSLGLMHWEMWWIVLIALVVCGGAVNIFNFMDGINGMTVGYSLAVLVPLLIIDNGQWTIDNSSGFIETSYLMMAAMGILVFGYFNFRPKDQALCFPGDVGSIGIAFILLFAIGRLIVKTQDVTYLILLLVYGVDGCLTIVHRLLLRENLRKAHRKHAYQLMANELKMGHLKVSLLYMALQLVVSLGFIFLCPNTPTAHWWYLIGTSLVLCLAYVAFVRCKVYNVRGLKAEG